MSNVRTRFDTWPISKAWFKGLLLGTAMPRVCEIVIAVLIPMVPKTDTSGEFSEICIGIVGAQRRTER